MNKPLQMTAAFFVFEPLVQWRRVPSRVGYRCVVWRRVVRFSYFIRYVVRGQINFTPGLILWRGRGRRAGGLPWGFGDMQSQAGERIGHCHTPDDCCPVVGR